MKIEVICVKMMNFKTYMKILQVGEFVIYFAVASVLLFAIMPSLGMHTAVNIIFTMLAVVGTFGIISKVKRKVVGKAVVARTSTFYETLETSVLVGMGDYFLGKAKNSNNPVVLDNNIFMAYALHNYESKEPFEYIQNIIDIEESYDDFFYFRVVQIREIMIFRFIQHGKIDKALQYAQKQLHYIEQSIDQEQVPEESLDYVLYASSRYRHLIRFINSPNPRTAYAIKIEDDNTKYDDVQTYYSIAKIFMKNKMKKEAKVAAEKVLEYTGDFRILKELKEYAK